MNTSTSSANALRVGVIGVGYVGEHLVSAFSKKYAVTGFDISPARREYLIEAFGNNFNVAITGTGEELAGCDLFCVSVPTLLLEDKTIDASFLKAACATVEKYAKPGSVVVMESSVHVGMTRMLLNSLTTKGIFVGFSPERVDPGRVEPPVEEIPKIISGIDEASLDKIHEFYSSVFKTVVKVSSMETAEMCKLHENCYRMVNIAYANEIADACVKHNIDPLEMIKACSTKPFGFMPFTPSTGVGGFCIPNNPGYLLHNNDLPLLHHATETTHMRPKKKADQLIVDYPEVKRVLVVGVGFKPGESVVASSPGMAFANALGKHEDMKVMTYDPLVDPKSPHVQSLSFVSDADWNEDYIAKNFDMVYVVTKQHKVNWNVLGNLNNNKSSVKVVFGM
jgi:nucleotide sugar dehydrogenase